MDFDLKAKPYKWQGHRHEEEKYRRVWGPNINILGDVGGELLALALNTAYSAGLAEREKMEAAEAIFRGNIGAILVAMDGGNQTLAKHLLVRTLSALDGVKDGGR